MVPYFSSPANMAAKLVDVGADALVLFNRCHQTDIDLRQGRDVVRMLQSWNVGRRPEVD
jgi:hypothetical protein